MSGSALPIRGYWSYGEGLGDGQSKEAQKVADQMQTALSAGPSISLLRFEDLWKVFQEAQEVNWDGYGALPASYLSYKLARNFLGRLPSSIPEPEPSILPNGHVALEWIAESNKRIMISFSEDGLLSFASLWGRSKVNGAEPFVEAIPSSISCIFSRLIDGTN
jgi:hypothetical protein